MKPDIETDALVDALRADLPTDEQSARVRARLVAAGVLAGAAVTGTASAAAAAGATKAGASSLGSLWSAATALPVTAKVSIATGMCAAVSAVPVWHAVAPDEPAPKAAATRVASTSSRTARPSRAREVLSAPAPAATQGSSEVESKLALAQPKLAEPASVTRSVAVSDSSRVTKPSRASSAPSAAAAIDSHGEREPVAAMDQGVRGSQPPVAVMDALPAPESVQAAPQSAPAPPEARENRTTLAAETALLDQALAALRGGELERANALIAEHQRRFPTGLLRRERERTRLKVADALNKQGRPSE